MISRLLLCSFLIICVCVKDTNAFQIPSQRTPVNNLPRRKQPRTFSPSFSSSATTSILLSSSSLQLRATSSRSSSSSSSSRTNRVASLMEWAKQVGIQTTNSMQLVESSLSSDYEDAGLGWVASSTLTAGSVILSVPSNVALCVETPGDGPDDPSVFQLLLVGSDGDGDNRKVLRDLPWYVQMAVYLYKLDQVDATKDGNDGNIDLRPWLDSLPRQFDTPIHWSNNKKALQELQYEYLQESVLRQEETWKAYHRQLGGLLLSSPTEQQMSWESFLWGCECARSRAFSGAYTGSAFNPLIYAFTLLLVTIYVGLHLGTLEQAANGAGVVLSVSILKDFVFPKLFKKKRYVICPMIDMTNHRSVGYSAQVSFEYFGNAYSLAICSGESVQAGKEVFISYGRRSNDQLLQYYGFVEQDNPHDVYVMPPLRKWDIDALEKACGRTFAAGRLEKLDRAGLLGKSDDAATGTATTNKNEDAMEEAANLAGGVVLTRAVGIDPAVLQALRALVSTDEEWNEAGQAIGNFAEELSPENEKCARLAAKTAIELELASKPSTLEEDKDLLRRLETMKSLDASREEKLAVMFRIEKKKLLMETAEKLR